MIAEVGGIRKKTETVLLAEFLLIKNIKIVNAPNETKNIWWLIAIIKVVEKFIKGFWIKKIIIIKWNKNPPIAWYILLTDKGKLLLIFFCQIVAQVTAIKEIITATTPKVGKDLPISKPITKAAPTNPKKTPSHLFHVIFSFKIGPAKAFVNTGWSVTIKAAIPVGRPIEIE